MATAERPDGLCWRHRKAMRARDARIMARAARPDPLPPATCTVTTEAHRPWLVEVEGEITSDGWDRIGDALAEKTGQPHVEIDLRRAHHARSMGPRVASYLTALSQSGSRVLVFCSRYLQACVCASRYGAGLAVEWRLP